MLPPFLRDCQVFIVPCCASMPNGRSSAAGVRMTKAGIHSNSSGRQLCQVHSGRPARAGRHYATSDTAGTAASTAACGQFRACEAVVLLGSQARPMQQDMLFESLPLACAPEACCRQCRSAAGPTTAARCWRRGRHEVKMVPNSPDDCPDR